MGGTSGWWLRVPRPALRSGSSLAAAAWMGLQRTERRSLLGHSAWPAPEPDRRSGCRRESLATSVAQGQKAAKPGEA